MESNGIKPDPQPSKLRAVLHKLGVGRGGPYEWWAYACGMAAVVMCGIYGYATIQALPEPTSRELLKLTTLMAQSIVLWVLSAVLTLLDLNWRRRKAQALLSRYVESIRRYTVENIEPMRANVEALQAVNSPIPDEKAPESQEEPELKTRDRNTLLKIIYGMAKAAPYNFDPDAKRSDAAPIIASATDAAGCSVSDDTVRKWLKEAAKVAR